MLEYLMDCGFDDDKDYTHQDFYQGTIKAVILEFRKYKIEYFDVPIKKIQLRILVILMLI